MVLNVNTDELIAFTNKLEKISKSAFPTAVRGALNSAAFDMKKDTLLKEAKVFKKRHNGNIYKKFSKVNMANGLDVNTMKSEVGFTDVPKSDFSEDLEVQDEGGKIKDRTFIAIKGARKNGKMVKEDMQLSKVMPFVIKSQNGRTDKQKFVRAAFRSVKQFGSNAYVLGNFNKGRATISKILSITSNRKSRKLKIKRAAIYTVKKDFAAPIKATNFRKKAAHETGLKIDKFYIKQFERLIK